MTGAIASEEEVEPFDKLNSTATEVSCYDPQVRVSIKWISVTRRFFMLQNWPI